MYKVNYLKFLKEIMIENSYSVQETLNVFKNCDFTILPVINNKGTYLGLIALEDLLKVHSTKKENISNFIIKYPAIKKSNLDFSNIRWDYNSFDIVPIVEDEGKLLGFIPKELIINEVFNYNKRILSFLKQLIDSIYNGVIAIDTEGNIIAFNRAAEKILGHKKENVLGKHISHIDPAMGLLKTLETQKPSIGVKNIINGYTILSNRTPLIEGDKCVGAVGVFVDISDLERISSELDINKALTQELNTIIESSSDGLYIIDNRGKVIRVNSAWEDICGFSREYVVGKYAQELIDEGCYDNSAALLALEKKKTTTVMLEMTSGPQKGKKIIATGTPIFDEEGNVKQVVVNVRDITALENLKAQLEETRKLSKKYANELEKIRLQQLNIDDIVIKSPVMKKVAELVIRVSQVDSTVIITGESGVGKEVIAKKIHLLSKRRNNSLIKINCGAIPENLLESELFGYEGGAFTGAKREGKPGMFELASGGTLFLDEIGDLPLNLQVKLLRVLQEKEVIRIGGLKPIKVDTRIIAATNKNLDEMVKEGTFREDLYYRLNVVNIQIPPLRNRPEDLPPLISSILNKLNKKYCKNIKLSQPVIEKLLKYNWPGNIRELENTLESLVVLASEETIQLKHLPDNLLSCKGEDYNPIILKSIIPLKKAIEETENQLLRKAIQEYGTTRSVAKALGVNQSTVVRKMQKYRIKNNNKEKHQDDAYLHLLKI